MTSRSIIVMICIMTWVAGGPCSAGAAELNGYTFSDDSIELWRNPFFSSDDRLVDINTTLYGYGDFSDKQLSQSYHQTFPVGGVECAVVLEQGYYPVYSETTSSFRMEYFNGYIYYAKDTQDNIHVLKTMSILNNQTYSWEYTGLAEGQTTLKYPSDPVPGQQIFCGRVEGTEVQVGDTRGCATLFFDSLPQFPSRTVTEYIAPEVGIVAIAYNWEGRLNGFSADAVAPEDAEEEGTTWEEWKDDHCFISMCTPHGQHSGKLFRTVTDRFMRMVKNALTVLKDIC